MKAMIVDDEPPARRELRRLLRAHPWIELVDDSGNIDDAGAKIELLCPDLLFLDIQMPGGSGFDLLARLDVLPQVILTTAYQEHAVHAFEVNALDYLLKPIDPTRLALALERVRKVPPEPILRDEATVRRLFVRDGSRCWFVPVAEVRLFSAEGNYVRLCWGDAKTQPLLGRSLAALEQRLDSGRFFRANRSQIVNLDFIGHVELGDNGNLRVRLRGGPDVTISRRQARLFKARMSI